MLQNSFGSVRRDGTSRPSFAVVPGPGQESVWDYPRPPRVESVNGQVEVWLAGERIAATDRALRVLETSHPPAVYLPPDAFAPGALVASRARSTVCEFKGRAEYLDLVAGTARVPAAAWRYPQPWPGFESIAGFVSLYPDRVDACLIDGERVRGQAGGFYGGWITSGVVGPFKGEPGTLGW